MEGARRVRSGRAAVGKSGRNAINSDYSLRGRQMWRMAFDF
jgi:hypothetical protein